MDNQVRKDRDLESVEADCMVHYTKEAKQVRLRPPQLRTMVRGKRLESSGLLYIKGLLNVSAK